MPTPTQDSNATKAIEVRHGIDTDLKQHQRQVKRLLTPVVPRKDIDDFLSELTPTAPVQTDDELAQAYNAQLVVNLQSDKAQAALANAIPPVTDPYAHLRGNAEQRRIRTRQYQMFSPLVVDANAIAVLSQHSSDT